MKNLLTILSLALALSFFETAKLCSQTWLWSTPIGGIDEDLAHGVTTDSQGNAYVTGSFSGSASFGATVLTSTGETDIYVAKYNSDGTVLWAIQAGGTGADEGKKLSLDIDGNIFVTGEFSGNANFETNAIISNGGLDVFLAKYDPDGNLLVVVNAFGNATDDEVNGIDHDVNGFVYISGEYDAGVNFSDLYISKFEDNGLVSQWTELIGGSGFDFQPSIGVDDSGNSYVSGNFQSTISIGDTTLTAANNVDFLVAKYLPNGILAWVRQIQITGFGQLQDIDVGVNGDCYIVGNIDFIADFGSLILTADAEMEALYAKYDATGTVLWAGRSDNAGWITGRTIAADAAGNSYIAGDLEAFNAFGSLNMASVGEDDSYVVKLDSNGVPEWGKNIVEIENIAAHYVTDITVGSEDSPLVIGQFNGEIGFDNTSLFPASGGFDGFLAKVGEVSCADITLTLSTSNISDTEATVSFEAPGASEFIYRYRQLPNGTWFPTVTTTATSVTLTNLSPGTEYLVRVRAFCDGLQVALSTIQFITTSTTSSCLDVPQNLTASNISTTEATVSWTAVDPTTLVNHRYRYRMTGGAWVRGLTTSPSVQLTGLNPGTTYEFIVRNQCTSGNSPVSSISFTTGVNSASMQLSPNPVSNSLMITPTEFMVIRIYDLNGVLKRELQVDAGIQQVDVSSFEKGIYIIKGVGQSGIRTERMVKE